MSDADVVVIGSGIGGLVAGALLAYYGKRVIICESHGVPGGAAHGFTRRGFRFDTGPSFYCGLGDIDSLNPLCQVLKILGERVEAIAYDPLGHYHFPDGTLPIYCQSDRYQQALAQITPQGAKELQAFQKPLLQLYEALSQIPTIALRSDWKLLPILATRYLPALWQLLPHLGILNRSAGHILNRTVRDPWVRRLIDLECFLLSGLKADGTVAPEVAFMLGERDRSVVDYPLGGSEAIIQALIRGLTRWGGELKLGAHVEKISIEQGRVTGVQLRRKERLTAPIVISNATLWDTFTHLLSPEDLPSSYRQQQLSTPAVESFMHLHLGIRAEGLEGLTGHHVVVHSQEVDVTTPGNTCMISIPSVWDKSLAPEGHHCLHAYTLEPFARWSRDPEYADRKWVKSQPLYQAVERVIPDIRERIVLELVGTPLTHSHYLRRHRGTYGPAIAPGQGTWPSCHTPIPGLYRVGDSTLPGIGVPAVAASGILCANTLVPPQIVLESLNQFQ
ncbi:NAD(P)/FAD-dependent oxidoreductase [Roseofilum sp. BLCC_M91]|uniref:NAD(P)/FAD-dependent oxidoreductase n=1 Tax=Roseofilum halophilum BLCC-M91 TaxID=3022259 RepID=A0ABT7BP73_9CYAN|nr:NAD(P)/FAD-dependent oxidoreductase [Roseofilum halophilum]MDJ1180083.1 NAD(P)/FAD-dependent oxidoreductase [Roseofilum halophilum BLCC-M91]